MNHSEHSPDFSEDVKISSKIIRKLYAHDFISNKAKQFAIREIEKPLNWGAWLAKFMMILANGLGSAGIICFIAYNWVNLGSFTKLAGIQAYLVIMATLYVLQKQFSKLYIFLSCLGVGYFMLTFGQIYQTGADAYQLFLAWAIFIFPWVVISEAAICWYLWLILCNVFASLYWSQIYSYNAPTHALSSILIAFHLVLLALRELAEKYAISSVNFKSSRAILVMVTLWHAQTEIMKAIFFTDDITNSQMLHLGLAIIIHPIIYYFYRYKFPNITCVALVALSSCLVLESIAIKLLTDSALHQHAVSYLVIAIITIIIFGSAVSWLRKVAATLRD